MSLDDIDQPAPTPTKLGATKTRRREASRAASGDAPGTSKKRGARAATSEAGEHEALATPAAPAPNLRQAPSIADRDAALRAEAAEALDEIPIQEATKKTQIIAIYGKGGIGKSFTLANLSCMMAEQGLRVLLIGCDPKSDTTSLLFGGKACPTIIETSTQKKLAG
ncbi:MAG: AAA family ATPase, partial [Pseudomonadota bacterium]